MPATATVPAPSKVACHCGSTRFDPDGWCVSCGSPRPRERRQKDRIVVGPGLAGVTDTGCKHKRNDDAFAISGPPGGGAGTVGVLCDGVSRSQSPDVASENAVIDALEAILAALASGASPVDAIKAGIVKAHASVCSVPYDKSAAMDPPAATIVAFVVGEPGQGGYPVTYGWLGDSRIYALSKGSGVQLTRDHSWVNMVVDSGQMTEDKALADPRAHQITKCLGTEDFSTATPCPEPGIGTDVIPFGSWILMATDGLTGYAQSAGALAGAANGRLWRDDAFDVCQTWVDFAKVKGGIDNVTAVLSRLP